MTEQYCITIVVGRNGELQVDSQGHGTMIVTTGDASIEHWLDSFRATLVAVGFSAELAGKLDIQDVGNGQTEPRMGDAICAGRWP